MQWPRLIALAVFVLAASLPLGAASQQDALTSADALLQNGDKLRAKGTEAELQQAIDLYLQARRLFRTSGNRDGEAVTLSRLGSSYFRLRDLPHALEFLNEALAMLHADGNPYGEAYVLGGLASVYRALDDNEHALEVLKRALPLYRATGDPDGEAGTLNGLGLAHAALNHYAEAIASYTQMLVIVRKAGDHQGEAVALTNMGLAYRRLGEHAKALEHYNQALTVERASNDRSNEAYTLNNMAGVYNEMGQKLRAVELHLQALPMYRDAGDKRGEATDLNNLGALYDELGDSAKALEYLNQALPLFRAIGNRGGEADALANVGRLYARRGERQEALDLFTQTLAIFRAIGDRDGEATALNNLGAVYEELEQDERAVDLYTQALALYRAVGDRDGEASVLGNLGVTFRKSGRSQLALETYTQALQLNRAVGDRSGEAMILNNLGTVYSQLGDAAQELESYTKALAIYREMADRPAEAGVLNNVASAYLDQGDTTRALELHRQALAICREVGDVQSEAWTLAGIAWVERDLGQLAEARTDIEAVLAIFQNLRTKIVNPDLRVSYFSGMAGFYAFNVDVLMGLHRLSPGEGYDRLALSASEAGRARGLLDLLAEGSGSVREGVDPVLLEREQDVARRLDALAVIRTKTLAGQPTADEKSDLEKRLRDIADEQRQIDTQIRQKSPHYASLTRAQPLAAADIQALLDADTMLLEFSLGPERSYLWAVTRSSIASFELPRREKIRERAREVYQLLTAQSRGVEPDQANFESTLTEFSAMLFGDAGPLLAGKRLAIVADGELNLIPFSALPAPEGSAPTRGRSGFVPLMVDHEIVNLPSASVLAVLRRETANRPPAKRLVAMFADPVFSASDERVVKTDGRPEPAGATTPVRAVEQFARLSHTDDEQAGILANLPPGQFKRAIGFDANRAAATSADLAEYRYVHFATHGVVDSEHPELSGLVLSLVDARGQPQEGFLRLNDVFNLRLRADLAVLSACETGLGRQMRGEGIVGLTRGFMYAGAPRVVVSLWSVNDASTAALMKRFYAALLQGQRPAAALRAAQLAMWTSADEKWRPPYFWAAFTLQGEWR